MCSHKNPLFRPFVSVPAIEMTQLDEWIHKLFQPNSPVSVEYDLRLFYKLSIFLTRNENRQALSHKHDGMAIEYCKHSDTLRLARHAAVLKPCSCAACNKPKTHLAIAA